MMNKYVYTDKQLNELNQGPNVYSVNTEFAQRKENRTNIVTAKSDNELKKGETNTITTSDGQEFRVVATKSHGGTGFDGLVLDTFFFILVLFIFCYFILISSYSIPITISKKTYWIVIC